MKIKRSILIIFIFLLLSTPAFLLLLTPGIPAVHDPVHYLRLYGFDRCIKDFQIPCRWVSESGFGLGAPVFNYYGQTPYLVGEVFYLLGSPIVLSLKLAFAFSLIASGLGMFLLSNQLFKNIPAAFLSGALYVYAPYRAYDVFVRGAFSESMAFVFFPLIILFFNKYVLRERIRDLALFILLLVGLLTTHILSFLMFMFFLVPWTFYYLVKNKKFILVKRLIVSLILVIGGSSFYLVPLFLEKEFVSLDLLREGHFYFANNFSELGSLMSLSFPMIKTRISGEESLGLSLGYLHWILALTVSFLVLKSKRIFMNIDILHIVFIGLITVYLTNDNSVYLWKSFPVLQTIQFPWRFISLSLFSFALVGGTTLFFIKKTVQRRWTFASLLIITVLLNFHFFGPKVLMGIKEQQVVQDENMLYSASLQDRAFLPKDLKGIPSDYQKTKLPVITGGEGRIPFFKRTSKDVFAQVSVESESAELQFPVTYFPGWQALLNGDPLEIYSSGRYEQISVKLTQGQHDVLLRFTDTPIRRVANVISLISAGLLVGMLRMERGRKNESVV